MNRNRKRRQEAPAQKHSSGLLTDGVQGPKDLPVVDVAKVVQALARLSGDNEPACVKVPVCDSEAEHFETQQDFLAEAFSVSVTVLAESPSLDRIVTIYGTVAEALRCALYLCFVLNSQLNNFTKSETFTLKSHNYHFAVLVEGDPLQMAALEKRFPAIDIGPYERNANLHTARLSGDFSSLFDSLCYIFSRHPYRTYATDESIRPLPVVGGDEQREGKANNGILSAIYGAGFLKGSDS